LLREALACLDQLFDIRHAMVLMLDPQRACLYTVASRGYEASGVGSEIPVGAGVIGVAARENTPIRIGHMTSEYGYSRALRESATLGGLSCQLATEIPFPGLAQPGSQLAVPFGGFGKLSGILYVESPHDLRFSYDDEDVLVAVGGRLGLIVHMLQNGAEPPDEAPAARPDVRAEGPALEVRRHAADDSIFLGDDYLIKGVAGAIFWKLVRDHQTSGRTEFTNRELRLDATLGLPDISDNLEARLILLTRRLEERNACVRIEKTGRGRFHLRVNRPLLLKEQPA
jgi:adenylate cyclase